MPELSLPFRDWQRLLEFSHKKFQKFIEICQNDAFITMKIERKMVCVRAPILLILRDEYTDKQIKKSRLAPDSIGRKSGINKQIEPDIEKRQNNTENSLSPTSEREARKVLRAHGIDPDSSRGDHCLKHAAANAKDTPAGYLVGTFRNNPDFGAAHTNLQPREMPNEPQHISMMLLRAGLIKQE